MLVTPTPEDDKLEAGPVWNEEAAVTLEARTLVPVIPEETGLVVEPVWTEEAIVAPEDGEDTGCVPL